jgi:ABC-type nickel/cobalt efflux system permease component RcnA
MGKVRFRRGILLTVVSLAGLMATPQCSTAHPLGNFSISHYTGIHLDPAGIELRYIIDMAEIPTFQEIQATKLALQGNVAELEAYLAEKVEALVNGLILEVNGQRLSLQAEACEVLFPPGAGGLPTLKMAITYRAVLGDGALVSLNELRYRDTNFAGRAGWKEIIATAGQGVMLLQSSVPERDRSRALSDYPTDLLNSPPQDLEAHVVFAPGGGDVAAGTSQRRIEPARLEVNRQATTSSSFGDLVMTQQLSFGIVLLASIVAAGLGAFHALEPGHGKTVVAAYLVGSKGTAWHALLLGLIVTGTHTVGVYLLGAVTLFASRYVVPERLYPWLGVISGLIIAVLGGALFLRRYAASAAQHDHVPAHRHPHRSWGHHHTHEAAGPPVHHHGSQAHHHPVPAKVSQRELLALGVTGGIVPCPAALVVLLSALSMHRVGFGLLLIVAFSLGLAAVLIATGILMVYARRVMVRFQGEGVLITRWLPLTSAAVITVFGVAIVVQSLVAAGMLPIRW